MLYRLAYPQLNAPNLLMMRNGTCSFITKNKRQRTIENIHLMQCLSHWFRYSRRDVRRGRREVRLQCCRCCTWRRLDNGRRWIRWICSVPQQNAAFAKRIWGAIEYVRCANGWLDRRIDRFVALSTKRCVDILICKPFGFWSRSRQCDWKYLRI